MSEIEYRMREFAELGVPVRWLDDEHALNAFTYASTFYSTERFGERLLSVETVGEIERHVVRSATVAYQWLRDRFPSEGTVQVLFGKREVAVLDAKVFLSTWQDLFLPGRDDAIVLHNVENHVGFYWHEDELEVGRRHST